ncbi:MAG: MBL fold metallo-hydrolase [Dysgonamonadaceae bacterium]|jgi:phosphoribosyl 1,2-cyclic phosphate phosphodiesterase|nr:MBL fold metallo-hydrolase [Dysgonamonadaceae bacterium]
MKIRFLGTGTSTGVPEIACQCKVCTSTDIRDKRLRSSMLVEVEHRNILIDCGPDFRFQMLRSGITRLDGVLLTHEHYDHVSGLDDLRPFSRERNVDVYAEWPVVKAIETHIIPYAFAAHKYPGLPEISIHTIDVKHPFQIDGVTVVPIRVIHGEMPILGYRIGNMAYLTDLKYIPDEEYAKMEALDVLIISALREREHISHQTLSQALEKIERINPRCTYLIHMSHHFGLHADMEKRLPKSVHIAYDGLSVEI